MRGRLLLAHLKKERKLAEKTESENGGTDLSLTHKTQDRRHTYTKTCTHRRRHQIIGQWEVLGKRVESKARSEDCSCAFPHNTVNQGTGKKAWKI